MNKFGTRNASYQMISGKLVEIIKSLTQPTAHRYAVQLETVYTYTPRQEESDALRKKLMVRRRQVVGVPHAVAVHGLGGTGKSQLALKYAEDHKHCYDPVLWIDATSVNTVLFSFKECAKKLNLFVGTNETNASSLVDSKAHLDVLGWLCDRRETDDEWLVIFDNADDVTWGLKKFIPKGGRGNIIITSRDNWSPMLIDGGCEQLEVSAMSLTEAKTLLLRRLQWDVDSTPQRIQQSCQEVVQRLGCLPLAVDLAGAYIGNEPNQEMALTQYIEDYDKRKDDLLQDGSLRGLLPSEKTVWTVWNATFEKLEKDHARFLPTVLLAFLARFRGNIIQDEVFHLASLGMVEVDRKFQKEEQRLPSDIRNFLRRDDIGWDNFFYRRSRELLVRYSLAQRVGGDWPGITMHSLVKWRAMQYKKHERWGWWNSIFVLAACHQLPREHESLRFRRHLLTHVPEVTQAWLNRNNVEENASLFMQGTFNRVHYIRQKELYRIHKSLANTDGRRIVVLLGMAGVGKTQLAASYVECHRSAYSDIFWLDANSEDSVKISYARFAEVLSQKSTLTSQLSKATAQSNEDEIMPAVKKWLSQPWNTQWLMICDNYDNPVVGDIPQFLPPANHGSFIIITRSSNVKLGCQIQIRNLDISDSLEILFNTSLRTTTMNGKAFALHTEFKLSVLQTLLRPSLSKS
jgi:CO dehydrogenase nickel-insertion accessory protein CooC1